MENGQEENKSEDKNDATPQEVKKEEPVVETTSSEEQTKHEEPSEEILQKIKSQIEFYFGDVNMQRDRFLIEQTKLDDGWIPMTVMMNFKLLASLSKDPDIILKALESSSMMEISEDKKKIRRSPKCPLPMYNEEYRKTQEAKTAYVKGFPQNNMSIQKLMTFFTAFEPFENIIMRKYTDKERKLQFKGSIFVQFKTLDDAKAFMARESVQYEGTELIRKWSADYSAEKAKEKEEFRQKRSQNKAKKNENTQKKEEVESEDGEEENDESSGLPKGSLIHFSGVSSECSREDIKQKLGDLGARIAYIEFKKGDKEGWVRLQGENAAKVIVEKMDNGKLVINEKEVTFRILEGEEEDKYLAKANEIITNTKQRSKRGKRGRGVRGNRKRRNSPIRDAISSKKKLIE